VFAYIEKKKEESERIEHKQKKKKATEKKALTPVFFPFSTHSTVQNKLFDLRLYSSLVLSNKNTRRKKNEKYKKE
jgi:hypothetical protein